MWTLERRFRPMRHDQETGNLLSHNAVGELQAFFVGELQIVQADTDEPLYSQNLQRVKICGSKSRGLSGATSSQPVCCSVACTTAMHGR